MGRIIINVSVVVFLYKGFLWCNTYGLGSEVWCSWCIFVFDVCASLVFFKKRWRTGLRGGSGGTGTRVSLRFVILTDNWVGRGRDRGVQFNGYYYLLKGRKCGYVCQYSYHLFVISYYSSRVCKISQVYSLNYPSLPYSTAHIRHGPCLRHNGRYHGHNSHDREG
jgi:hypothetical protein